MEIKIKRITILTMLALSISLACVAQAPRIQWQKNIGGDKDDELYSIEQTADGGYILGGSSNSSIWGDKNIDLCSGSDFDYWIVKLDCKGDIQWQKEIGAGSSDELVNSIRQTRDGGYIVAGYTNSLTISCNKTVAGYGLNDWWALRLDSVGNVQWQIDLGGTCNDYLNSVEQTDDGGFIFGGNARSNANVSGNRALNMCGNIACAVLSDYWVVKIDSLGNIQWQQNYGSTASTIFSGGYPGDDNLNVIHQTRDGGYILGGSSNGGISCNKNTNAYSQSYDYWVVKIDAIGNIQWQSTIGGDGVDELTDMQQTTDGGYILGGTTTSNISGNKTSNTWNNSSDYYVVKIDSVGNIQWQKNIGGDKHEALNAIEQTTDQGYILGGFSNSDISGDKTNDPLRPNQYDYWVVKINSIGTIQWQMDIGRNDTQAVLFDVHQTTDGGYILGGVSNPYSANLSGRVNNASNPFGNQFGGYGTHFWVIKLGDCGSGYCGATPVSAQSLCAGDSVQLSSIIKYGGISWGVLPGGSSINSLSCTNCPDPIATPDKTTRYVVVSTSNPDLYCNDTITVFVVPAREGISKDTIICLGDSAQLYLPLDSSIGTIPDITWSPSTYLSNDAISDPVCLPLSSISYYITSSFLGKCKMVDTFNVFVSRMSKLSVIDTFICQHTIAPVLLLTEDSLTWYTSAAYLDGIPTQPVINTSTPGYDTFYVSNRCGKTPVYIQVISMPAAVLTDTAICNKEAVQLNNIDAKDIQYRWNTGSTSCCITVDKPGIYTVEANNVCGRVIDTVNVAQKFCRGCLWAPDAFTPNGDGKNDRYHVISQCGNINYHILIANRLGQVVYESYDLAETWDGTFRNQPVDMGVYYYWIRLSSLTLDEEQLTLRGDVTVIR